ncbi:aspartate-semialdehyde dehydrogenase [Leucothrix pacifica]|uniref:Aspartate-semialdehyde dehydrogenase n=1 Tax=Leucothrix pacifica TaxID=1247513 RepID=A0A317CD85_9GAMM|nr:aspartate-semialdehyde dehydrogenase [Leucothrix pacifica]PWQ94072.1 aspartate-semialdehyde dehydrogenase [Leucothrix pacifica]
MHNNYDIAIVGATGMVGEAMLSILAEREFPVGKLFLLAGENSAGSRVEFDGTYYKVEKINDFDFSQVQIALFSAGAKVSEEYAPIAAQNGCVVIDNTSQFRNDYEVPLVVPEVNAHAIAEYHSRGIIANPNCSTIQMLVALKPIHDLAKITRINVATYQAVSGAGKKGVEELASQTAKLLNGLEAKTKTFGKQIAFNVLPHIDEFQDNGYTREEMKMVWETQKILEDDEILVNPTTVRVPVFFGHSEAIHIETREKISATVARELLQSAPGVSVMDEMVDGGYPTPVTEAANKDAVFVGRIREDLSHSNGLNLWVVADNVRKGAALNSIQIAEILIRDYL